MPNVMNVLLSALLGLSNFSGTTIAANEDWDPSSDTRHAALEWDWQFGTYGNLLIANLSHDEAIELADFLAAIADTPDATQRLSEFLTERGAMLWVPVILNAVNVVGSNVLVSELRRQNTPNGVRLHFGEWGGVAVVSR